MGFFKKLFGGKKPKPPEPPPMRLSAPMVGKTRARSTAPTGGVNLGSSKGVGRPKPNARAAAIRRKAAPRR